MIMAHLSVIGSHTVNGLMKSHSSILKSSLFRDFATLFPEKFINVTNGVSPRRWLLNANPELSKLITSRIGHDWTKDLSRVEQLGDSSSSTSWRVTL
jgi:starch phosphorylase